MKEQSEDGGSGSSLLAQTGRHPGWETEHGHPLVGAGQDQGPQTRLGGECAVRVRAALCIQPKRGSFLDYLLFFEKH